MGLISSRMVRAPLVLASLLSVLPIASLAACPFCSAVSQTLTEEMASMDAVVIACLKDVAAEPGSETGVVKAMFEIDQIVKGAEGLGDLKAINTLYFGGAKEGDKFLIMGVDPPKVAWSTPLKISDEAVAYIRNLPQLPEKGVERLAFFLPYLQSESELLAGDAYDEFARAPYPEMLALEGKLDHEEIVAQIKQPEIPANHRRLYLVMLSVCGGPEDLPLLEQMLKSTDRSMRAGLDAMIGCYLSLTGAKGVGFIEELFLKNKAAEYPDIYSAIMALRFHGTETDCVPRARILEALRHVLDRPQMADLVIPDLARWEDWSQIDRLVRLFKDADDQTSWVRVPVINYLRACPKPEAEKIIEELKEIDPEAVKRADAFFPFSGGGASSSVFRDDQPRVAWDVSPSRLSSLGVRSAPVSVAANLQGFEGSTLEPRAGIPTNPISALGVFWLVGAVVMFAQWRILAGAGRR